VKVKKTILEELKLQNHTKHLGKIPKHNPFHFDMGYLIHSPLDCSVFYKFGYVRWGTTKLL
jgi:hypothetical protein